MKTLGIVLAIFLLPFIASAQKLVPMDEPNPPATTSETDYVNPNEAIVYKNTTPPVQQSTGKTYTQEELMRMPRRDANTIAGSVPGVDSRAGTTPNIRGAATSGTAYYVDGVRVYGALPLLSR
jgi:outer membrane receptor for ferrienterochelin and colicin